MYATPHTAVIDDAVAPFHGGRSDTSRSIGDDGQTARSAGPRDRQPAATATMLPGMIGYQILPAGDGTAYTLTVGAPSVDKICSEAAFELLDRLVRGLRLNPDRSPPAQ